MNGIQANQVTPFSLCKVWEGKGKEKEDKITSAFLDESGTIPSYK